MKKIAGILFIFFLICSAAANQKSSSLKLALLKYNGGGDWYSNPTALPNLAQFCNQSLGTDFDINYATVEVGSAELFNYPWLHMTGHGNVVFNDQEAENLRMYLMAGGFLHIDDNYGMDPFVRVAMKKVFPELEFVELPFDHPIYHQKYDFNRGLPKIHEHDGGSPQGYGLIYEGRVVCFYSFESDLGDGWEDAEVHNDPVEVRAAALQMGANIVQYSFSR
ncbi:MAG: DUF4159 domain-containing protein [Bacteroidota bacterium]